MSQSVEYQQAVAKGNALELDHRYKLLKRAYTEARYNQGYKITKKELEYLAKCVRKLLRLTKKICKEKIESFTNR